MKRILIVEDESDLSDAMVELLQAQDQEIQTAQNGKEALSLLNKSSFDLIISDINMPEMNGIELLRIIRLQNNSIPFIILTGYGDKDKIKAAWNLEAYDFLDKPISFESLSKVINKALSN
jgi:YesN/AraC family two-component response regulator